MKTFKEQVEMQEALEYHTSRGIPLSENVFRMYSEKYYELYNYARKRVQEGKLQLDGFDLELIEETDIGQHADYEGNSVPLDCPIMEEDKKDDVELNSPKRGGSKKFYVYVKNPKTGNVMKIEFGDTSGLKAKINDRDAARSFAARHNCDQKKDKTKAGYWACRLPKYAKQLGLSGGGNYFW